MEFFFSVGNKLFSLTVFYDGHSSVLCCDRRRPFWASTMGLWGLKNLIDSGGGLLFLPLWRTSESPDRYWFDPPSPKLCLAIFFYASVFSGVCQLFLLPSFHISPTFFQMPKSFFLMFIVGGCDVSKCCHTRPFYYSRPKNWLLLIWIGNMEFPFLS